MTQEYTGFIYLWVNNVNSMMYIGSHYGGINDGYTGSGTFFKRAYEKDPGNFTRYIIESHNGDVQSLKQLEQTYLEKYDVANNDKYYNIVNVAGGGYNMYHLSPEERTVIHKQAATKRTWFLTYTPEQFKELKLKKQTSWKSSPKLKEHSENSRKRQTLIEQSKTEEEKEIFARMCRDIYHCRSKKELDRIHTKRAKTITEWHKNMSQEERKKKSENMKKHARVKKGKHINKDSIGKCVPESELQGWLSNGWLLGMLPKKKKGECRWINKDKKQKFIQISKLQPYLDDGWVFGMFSRSKFRDKQVQS
jgi:hypothetical protein